MYQKGVQSWIKHLDFIIIDVFCLNIALPIAFMIQAQAFINPYVHSEYHRFAFILNAIVIVVALLSRAYKNILRRNWSQELLAVIKICMLVFLSSVTFFSLIQDSFSMESRNTLLATMPIFMALSFCMRLINKKVIRIRNRKSLGHAMLVVTTSNIADKVIQTLMDNEYGHYTIAGLIIVDKNLVGKRFKGIPVVADVNNAADYVCREWVDEVFIDVHRNAKYPLKLISEFETMGLAIHERLAKTPRFSEKKQLVEKIGGYTVLTTTLNYAAPWQLFIKRTFDIIGGIIGCIGMGLLLIVVGPLIKIKSPGPIFFLQERVGKNGKRFKLYKFRTMDVDAEERKQELMAQNRVKDGMMFKIEYDERIIGCRKLPNGKIKKGLGGWLRRLSIDEVPQFLNVLKGDMSLVGTRPPTVDEWEKYELHHRARLAIKPGITGMWQVSGRSKITDFEQVVKLDTKYIREWRILLDVKILLKTVVTVFKREGSM